MNKQEILKTLVDAWETYYVYAMNMHRNDFGEYLTLPKFMKWLKDQVEWTEEMGRR